MADQAQESSAIAQGGQRARRSSFRKSLTDCGLPPGYLDALEEKRRQLDESIHKFIASKEREYKQFEKGLKHQARRETAERGDISADGSQNQEDGQTTIETPTQEDFTGLFTPEFLPALSHEREKRSIPRSTPDQAISEDVSASQIDPAASARHLSTQTTTSSGSSVDGKLVSAMKSVSTETVQQPRRKRVSIAVGNSIVAPSDSVPVALSVNSSSSHSRLRGPRRDRSASFEDAGIPISLLTPALQQASKPVRQSVAGGFKVFQPETTKLLPGEDVGDMFDLEDTDSDAANFDIGDDSQDVTQDSLVDLAGRVSSRPNTQQSDGHGSTGEPPPSEDDDLDEVPLTPISGSFSAQPMDPGFRRPSAVSDPVYTDERSRHSSRAADDDGVYSSSFSRPSSKGSFTMSGSLGESYMAKNAEAMMGLKAQQQQRSETRHRTSSTVLPVR